jgi:hypothetical protein
LRNGSWPALLWFVLGACDVVFAVPPPVDATDGSGGDASDRDAIDAPPSVPGMVARYRMESALPVVADDVGGHDGQAMNAVAVLVGRDGGRALRFPAVSPSPHVVVPNDAAWDLPIAAIEVWVNPTQASAGEQRGIISRDNLGTSDGHLALVQLHDRYVVRVQRASDGINTTTMFLCSNQAPMAGQWTQIGINLGAPRAELWVDGVLGTRTDQFTLFGGTATCGSGDMRSIVGNDDPWVFGALAVLSDPGTANQISNPFLGGAIDDVTIWNERQLFDGD